MMMIMSDSFDLTSRPWIPCERLDGTLVELSTRDALAQAHMLRGIVDASPLVVAVLCRHLLAVLHRVYDGPATIAQWGEIATSGHFDADRSRKYLEKVRDRMDLFHPERPFAQTRGLAEQFKRDPIDELDLGRSKWGTARELFAHRPLAAQPSMTPAAACRALLAHQAFTTGGLIKKPGEPTAATAAPLTKSAVIIIRGTTLFHTLVANLLVYNPEEDLPIASRPPDRPTWESEPPPKALRLAKEPKRTPTGWLELLTWLSRRVELIRDGDRVVGFVRAVWCGIEDSAPRDPMVMHSVDKKRGFVPVTLNPRRAFWRDANGLFVSTGSESTFVPPGALRQVASRLARSILGDTSLHMIDFAGISSDQSRVDAVRREGIPVVLRELDDPDVAAAVRDAIQLSEDGVGALRSGLWAYAQTLLAPADRLPATEDVSRLVTSLQAEPHAWHALGRLFDAFLLALTKGDTDAARRQYASGIPRVIESAFMRATAASARSGAGLQARALGERKLHFELGRLGVTGRTTAVAIEGATS